jgi:hypothetical protein
MIRVVNFYHKPYPDSDRDIFIGRPSVLRNPFPVAKYGRDVCIDMHREDLKIKLINKDPEIINALNEIYELHTQGKVVNIICYCAPNPCHGDTLKSIILAKEKRNRDGN